LGGVKSTRLTKVAPPFLVQALASSLENSRAFLACMRWGVEDTKNPRPGKIPDEG